MKCVDVYRLTVLTQTGLDIWGQHLRIARYVIISHSFFSILTINS